MPTDLADIKIDPVTMEIVVVGGDVVVIRGYEEICQAAFIAARVLEGEWFLDPSLGWINVSSGPKGMPFGKGKTPSQISARAVRNLLTVQGIVANPAPTAAVTVLSTRVARLSYTAMTDWGLPATGEVTGP
jgi:hypothetical protein